MGLRRETGAGKMGGGCHQGTLGGGGLTGGKGRPEQEADVNWLEGNPCW